MTENESKGFTVVGVYEDNNGRFCDHYDVATADEAEKECEAAAAADGNHIIIAGVFAGDLSPVQ